MTKKSEKAISEMPLKTVFEALDEVVEKLSQEEVSLEESFSYYQQGMDLLKICNTKIDAVEKKVLILDENGEKHEFES